MQQENRNPPAASLRYLRFVRALVLGSALAAVPIALSGCGQSESPCATSAHCAPPDGHGGPVADAGPLDGGHPIATGPLPPPDLPLVRA